ncbi:response regulator [Variovorax sp. ZT5P49]|uniref:response regulator n=1 Tax=Variovorax sp. ZT5P49 TaxID=3443733 RepID=UPI003F48A185
MTVVNPETDGHILIVEDEPKLAALIGEYLHASGYAWTWLADGRDVLPSVKAHRPDLVLLDLMLPGQDGLIVCRELRKFSNVPVIMLTARVEEADRLTGLDIGADDYICKTPFSPREIVARVKAMLRRTGLASRKEHALEIDDDGYRAWWYGAPIELTRIEFRLLRVLAATPERVFPRDTLLNHLYTGGPAATDRTVDSHVKNLRRKLVVASSGQVTIRSIYGVGYKFESSRLNVRVDEIPR